MCKESDVTNQFSGIASFGKQQQLNCLVEDLDWHFDLPIGLLSFGDNYRWQTQLLGSASEESGTWLWAWANSQSHIPDHLLEACRTLKAYGEQHGIPELTTPQLSLDQNDGHRIALLASGICEANAYYRCAYDGGALFVLIKDENFPRCTEPPLQRLVSVFPQAISTLDIPDHRLALTGYLDHHHIGYEQDAEKIVVKEDGELVLTATFDDLKRLTHLEANLKPVA